MRSHPYMKSYRDLVAVQKEMEFTVAVFNISNTFPRAEMVSQTDPYADHPAR